MGVWGTGNFDNDTALDWVFELEETDDLSLIEQIIEVAYAQDYIDSDIASEALVAIEALARLKGNFGVKNEYAEDLDNWVEEHKLVVPDALIEKSKKVLERIISNQSELCELWEETDNFDDWLKEVNDLKMRLV